MALSSGAAAAQSAPAVPRPAGEFAIQLASGKQLLLSQYRGKVVAVEFLYTTCPACQRAAQHMSKLYRDLGSKGFQPLGVAFNDNASMLVTDFIRNFGVMHPVGFSPQQTVLNYLGITGRYVVPQVIIVDRKGVIRWQSPASGGGEALSEAALRQRVEELLQEPAGNTKKSRR
jgi:peroxiredoxin